MLEKAYTKTVIKKNEEIETVDFRVSSRIVPLVDLIQRKIKELMELGVFRPNLSKEEIQKIFFAETTPPFLDHHISSIQLTSCRTEHSFYLLQNITNFMARNWMYLPWVFSQIPSVRRGGQWD